jgi:hypothetical protein
LGYLGTAFFGLCTVVSLWRLLISSRPVITISPEGLHDTRVASAPIPWSDVTGISTWESFGVRTMVFAVKPAVEDGLGLTTVARWTRGVNRAIGADGLCISASGLKIDYDTLLQTCTDYAHIKRVTPQSTLSSVPSHAARCTLYGLAVMGAEYESVALGRWHRHLAFRLHAPAERAAAHNRVRDSDRYLVDLGAHFFGDVVCFLLLYPGRRHVAPRCAVDETPWRFGDRPDSDCGMRDDAIRVRSREHYRKLDSGTDNQRSNSVACAGTGRGRFRII